MARPKLEYAIFKLKPKTETGFEVDGDAIEKFSNVNLAGKKLAEIRAVEKIEGRDQYQFVILPVGPKGGPLLPPGA